MSDMFHVWYSVIYLGMAEPKGVMCDVDQGNKSWQVLGMEQSGVE